MATWLGLLMLVLAVSSRPVEVRLWRAGRLSDRAVTLLLLGRFPLVAAVAAVAMGASLLLGGFLVGLSLLPAFFLYRFMLGVVQDSADPPT